jgi:hypothetical protein
VTVKLVESTTVRLRMRGKTTRSGLRGCCDDGVSRHRESASRRWGLRIQGPTANRVDSSEREREREREEERQTQQTEAQEASSSLSMPFFFFDHSSSALASSCDWREFIRPVWLISFLVPFSCSGEILHCV